MTMTTEINTTLKTMERLEALSHALRWAVADALSLGVLTPVALWPVHQTLWCVNCRVPTLATVGVSDWVDYAKSLKAQRFTCDCGGLLIDHEPLVVLPPLTKGTVGAIIQ